MIYQDMLFLQIEYLVESACRSGFLVCVLLKVLADQVFLSVSHMTVISFCFSSLSSINPIQRLEEGKLSRRNDNQNAIRFDLG